VKCLELEVVGKKRGAIELANLVVESCANGKAHAGKRPQELGATRHDANRIYCSSSRGGSMQWIQSIKPRNKRVESCICITKGRDRVLSPDSGTLSTLLSRASKRQHSITGSPCPLHSTLNGLSLSPTTPLGH
jgi:hypothetical protein